MGKPDKKLKDEINEGFKLLHGRILAIETFIFFGLVFLASFYLVQKQPKKKLKNE